MDVSHELVEIIDEAGEVTSVATRAQMRAERLRHRSAYILVRNGVGEILVHQRSPNKDLWPSRWDIACGGVANVGESWQDAATRELAEELAITTAPAFLGLCTYVDADVSVLGAMFEVVWHGHIEFADQEVVDAVWLNISGLVEFLSTHSHCPDSVAMYAPYLELKLERPNAVVQSDS